MGDTVGVGGGGQIGNFGGGGGEGGRGGVFNSSPNSHRASLTTIHIYSSVYCRENFM